MCPIHADLIDVYRVTVTTSAFIQVETILKWFQKYEGQQIFQEAMTQDAAVALGAQVETVGIHAGVTVICLALKMASRWDAMQCPGRWKQKPIQAELIPK